MPRYLDDGRPTLEVVIDQRPDSSARALESGDDALCELITFGMPDSPADLVAVGPPSRLVGPERDEGNYHDVFLPTDANVHQVREDRPELSRNSSWIKGAVHSDCVETIRNVGPFNETMREEVRKRHR